MKRTLTVGLGLFLVAVYFVSTLGHADAQRRRRRRTPAKQAQNVGFSPEISKTLGDLRWGIVFIAIAVGFASFSTIISWGATGEMLDVRRGLYGVATFPLFIGIAFLGLHFFANENKRR